MMKIFFHLSLFEPFVELKKQEMFYKKKTDVYFQDFYYLSSDAISSVASLHSDQDKFDHQLISMMYSVKWLVKYTEREMVTKTK